MKFNLKAKSKTITFLFYYWKTTFSISKPWKPLKKGYASVSPPPLAPLLQGRGGEKESCLGSKLSKQPGSGQVLPVDALSVSVEQVDNLLEITFLKGKWTLNTPPRPALATEFFSPHPPKGEGRGKTKVLTRSAAKIFTILIQD